MKSSTLKSKFSWLYIAATAVALIIAVIAGLKYFGKL